MLYRFTPQGVLDTTFGGGDGVFVGKVGLYGHVLDKQGRIVVFGSASIGRVK